MQGMSSAHVPEVVAVVHEATTAVAQMLTPHTLLNQMLDRVDACSMWRWSRKAS
jgi:hypothetical protein